MEMYGKDVSEALDAVLGAGASQLDPATPLDTLVWDSMARIAALAAARMRFSNKLEVAALSGCRTVGELASAISGRTVP